MARIAAAILAFLLCSAAALLPGQGGASPSPQPDNSVFNDRVAADLLNQISSALVARNQKQMLDAFDLDKMNDGALFRQQIASFFGETGTIRAHFNLVQATMEDGNGVATVDAEMEADPRDDRLPPIHRQGQLRFVAARSAGWKFIDAQPRAFFSTSQP